MAAKTENPDMWISSKSNLGGGTYSNAFGEGQNTHNSRFLELADVAMAVKIPAKKTSMTTTAGATSSGNISRKTLTVEP